MTKKKHIKPLNDEVSQLINKRNKLESSGNPEFEEEIRSIEESISSWEAEENRKLIFENFKTLSDNPESVNLGQVWKTLKNLWPKHGNTLPVCS